MGKIRYSLKLSLPFALLTAHPPGNVAAFTQVAAIKSVSIPIITNLIFIGFDGDGNEGPLPTLIPSLCLLASHIL